MRGVRSWRAVFAAALLTAVLPAAAQVEIQDAWVTRTLPGQTSSAAYMRLRSAEGAAIVGVQCPLARSADLHEMRMDGDIMRMRGMKRLELPAGEAVELAPGGYHIMLNSLKHPLAKGARVPLRLTIEGRDKSRRTVNVDAEVRDPAGMGGMR